jgi:hypothetical protein
MESFLVNIVVFAFMMGCLFIAFYTAYRFVKWAFRRR